MENASESQGTTVPDKVLDEKRLALVVVVIILQCAISLVGVIGNMIIIKNLITRKGKSSEYFIINLAISDLSVCAVGIPLQVYEDMYSTWHYGAFLCKIIYPSQTLLVLVSIWTLTAMSLERHRAIITPLKPRLTKASLLKAIAFIWIIGICVIVPYVYHLSYNGKHCLEKWPMESSGSYYTLSLFIIDYFIPLTIITFCYARAGYTLYKNTKQFKMITEQAEMSSLMQSKRLARNKRIIKRFSFAVLVFLMCMLPGDCYWMYKSFGQQSKFVYEEYFEAFANILLYANSAINPFIFGACHAGCTKFLCGKQHSAMFKRRGRLIRFHSESSIQNLANDPCKNGIPLEKLGLEVYKRKDVPESDV